MQQFHAELSQLRQDYNGLARATRRALSDAEGNQQALDAIRAEHRRIQQQMTDLGQALQALRTERIGGGSGNPDIQRIENIPGRRVPFDFLVEIPINANDPAIQQGTITVSQEGPFVATSRYATFLSRFEFERIDPETQERATFDGRSNGRFRPIHSSWDMEDGRLPAEVQRILAMPGTGAPSYASPSNHSPYRTMEGDFRIEVKNQGSGYPRSNITVPSTFWTTQVNSPFALGALDFFARAEVIEFEVSPQHLNNPAAGNLSGYGAGGVFPFVDAQFDHHEGIDDREDGAVGEGDPDPITRLPNGILIIGFHGFRIIQPPGAVAQLGTV